MVDSGVNLTYDSLFVVVLREKSREELQVLPVGFVRDLVGYLVDKRGLLDSRRSLDAGKGDVDEGLFKQLGNARVLVRDLYECRERKIVRMALIFSKSKSDVVDVSVFLPEERVFFDSCVGVFEDFRGRFFGNIVDGRAPVVDVPSKFLEDVEGLSDGGERVDKGVDGGVLKSVRFLDDTEVVVDSELRSYGPFKREDVASVPVDLAEVLVSNGKAVII